MAVPVARSTLEILCRNRFRSAIGRLRTELSTGLRAAALSTGSVQLLRRWLALPEGRDDRVGWQLLHDSPGVDAVARAQARGHLAGLGAELA